MLGQFPGAWEDFPFGPGERVFKNAKGKMFALMNENQGGFRVTMKLTPDEAEEARVLPFVDRAAYVGRYGWVTVSVAGDGEWELAQDWVSRSWELVTSARSREQRGKSA